MWGGVCDLDLTLVRSSGDSAGRACTRATVQKWQRQHGVSQKRAVERHASREGRQPYRWQWVKQRDLCNSEARLGPRVGRCVQQVIAHALRLSECAHVLPCPLPCAHRSEQRPDDPRRPKTGSGIGSFGGLVRLSRALKFYRNVRLGKFSLTRPPLIIFLAS